MKNRIANVGDANVDFLVPNGRGGFTGHGSAAKLLANGLNVNSLRTNDTLLYDEWKQIDQAVLQAAQERLVVVGDLMSRGLTYTIPNGMGKTVLAYQDMSDLNDAEITMDGISKGRRDRPEYDINYMPLPIIHKDFSFNIRELEASRNGSMPLDTTMAEASARKVSQKVESIMCVGSSSYTFGGGTIYGLLDYPNSNSGSLTADWDDSAASGSTIIDDVLTMKQALVDAKHYGPYGLYVAKNYDRVLNDDYSSSYPKTIRSRILEIDGIEFVRTADFFTADYVALVQLTSDVVRVINALPITTVEWDSEGGMRVNFKVMTIMLPQIRQTQESDCGIAVYS